MAEKKFRGNQLFNGEKLLDASHVLVTDERGFIKEIVKDTEAGEDIQVMDGIISPGFINCHCHLELSHMKGHIPERSGLVDFVYKVVSERNYALQQVQDAIENAEAEMISNGIVAVGDICNNNSTLLTKASSKLQYYNFIEASGWLPDVATERFERSLKLYEEFKIQNPRSQISISPHAAYSVSRDLWKKIRPYFEDKVATIHNQETFSENEFFFKGSGDISRMYQLMNIDNKHHQPTNKTSLQSYYGSLEKAKNILLVHNTFTEQQDIDFIKSQNSLLKTYFCLCVNANQYIERALPPIELFQKNNCNIVLGTDSLASNWSLNIFDEIKTIQKNFPRISLGELLQWATLNGARALELENELGSFDQGKKPGVISINESSGKIVRLI